MLIPMQQFLERPPQMLSLVNFFLDRPASEKAEHEQEQSISVMDALDNKITEGFAFFHSQKEVTFLLNGKQYSLSSTVKMEPVLVESEKQTVLAKIVLHADGNMLELGSGKKEVLEEVYKRLKKTISHKGFNDYFRPLKRLGKGRFATVYLVENKITCEKMAAKVFTREGHKLEYKGKESLEKEIGYLQTLSHPNIIKFDGIYETGNLIYVVTEYLSGGTLAEFRRANSLKMEDHIVKIISDVAAGLSYLKERHIMHRDVKPENIVCRKEDGSWVLVDFGIAASCNSSEPLLYSRCGTMGYMAPEVLDESTPPTPYTQACDMYSLGIVCYELILGHLPFKTQMENIHDVKCIWEGLTKQDCSQLDPEIVKLLRALLETNPAVRWTPSQCLSSEMLSCPRIMADWKIYSEKKKLQSYNSILRVKISN